MLTELENSLLYIKYSKGNQSRSFLKKIDSLQQTLELESDDAILNGLPYVHAFRSFSGVVDACFGVELKSGYENKILEFKRLYLSLGITITPKVRSLYAIVFSLMMGYILRCNILLCLEMVKNIVCGGWVGTVHGQVLWYLCQFYCLI